MSATIFRTLFILAATNCFAMLIGNPAEPALQTSGIICSSPTWGSCRVSFLDDWVYNEKFQDELQLQGAEYTQTYMKLSTYAGQLTFNIKNIFDLYGIAGSSRMQLDKEIFTKRAFSWGVGGKLILFKTNHFFIGTDLKYFQTDQKPRYFVVEGLPYDIVGNYRLNYHEVQAALGVAYKISCFAPYINATYLISKVEPAPLIVLVRLPDVDEIVDVSSKRITGADKWGVAIGLTLIDLAKATLSFEWRTLNQNAVDWNLSIRF